MKIFNNYCKNNDFGGVNIKVYCPYCSSQNTLAIVCNDTNEPNYSKGYSQKCNKNRIKNNEAILSNTNTQYSLNYDGKIVKRKTYDRFCKDCKKPFYYISNLIISDIIKITFIIETKSDRWKYDIELGEKSFYNIDHNYFTDELLSSLTPVRKRKILESIDKSNLLNWKPINSREYIDYKIKWNVYIQFYNGQTYSRGGCDESPNEWNIFIDLFKRVFKNKLFDKTK